MEADVAIVGASFAGLGVAHHLRDSGLDVLLIDRKGIGEGRASTCGVPKALAEGLVPGSLLQSVGVFDIETPLVRSSFGLQEEYGVLDYRRFCAGLFRGCGARFFQAEAVGAGEGIVRTRSGDIRARHVIDCSGWRRALSKRPRRGRVFSGIEITAPIPADRSDRLSFFVDKRLVPGYGWIFPAGGGMGRVGIGGYASGAALNKAFMAFLGKSGIPFSRNELVGGAIPCTGLDEPLEGGIYFVGDSSRQVLPLSAEGIRTTLHFSEACAGSIEAVEKGRMSASEGRKEYERCVRRSGAGFGALGVIQDAFLLFPQPFFDACVAMGTSWPLRGMLMRGYLSIGRK